MRFTEEDKIQQQIVNAIRILYPKSLIFSVPNGGFRFRSTAVVLKCTGAVAGVADLIFLHNGKVFFIEVKTDKGFRLNRKKSLNKK